MKKAQAYSLSKTISARAFVIEHSVQLESIISSTLGWMLDIKWEDSKSLGFGSTCLSFSQKVQLIQDKKGLSKLMIDKLSVMMRIRNKFAHVESVSSFHQYFKLFDKKDEILKKFDKWYGSKIKSEENEEDRYTHAFLLLFMDNLRLIVKMSMEHARDSGIQRGESDGRKEFLRRLKGEVLKSPEANQIWNDLSAKMLKELKQKRQV